MVRLHLLGWSREIEVRRGTNLLAACRRAGVPLGASCRGQGVCGACKVEIVSGSEFVAPADPAPHRLACEARIEGPEGASVAIWAPGWPAP